jgi:purine-nucleoside phosphorylase
MSTVPETIVLRHMGIRVGAISCITNKAAGLSKELLSHEDVTQTGKKVEATFSSLIKTLLPTL